MSAVKSLSPSSPHRNTSIADAGEHLLPIRKVAEIIGFSRSTVHKKIAAGIFPPPVKPNRGGSSRWLASEIQDYIKAAVAARDRAHSAAVLDPSTN
jgi:predicted DNA-binding transcriptional regulator AlpA